MKIIEKLAQAVNLPIINTYTGMVLTAYDVRIIDIVKKEPDPKKGVEGGLYLNYFIDMPLAEPGDPFNPRNAKEINTVIKKNRLWGRTVSVLAADKSLIVRRVDAPAMEHDELVDSLRLTEREALPYPMEQAVVDAMVIGPSASEGQVRLTMAALDAAVAQRYNEFVHRTHFRHIAITIVPNAIAALVEHSNIIEKESTVPFVSIGKSMTGIYIFHGKELKFTRDISIGGENFTEAMIGEYDLEGEVVELSEDEAEEMKVVFGIPRGEDLFEIGAQGVSGEMLLDRLKPALEKMVMELGRSIDYFKNEFQIYDIPAVYLIGSAASLKHLPEYLTENLGYQFHAYDPFSDFVLIDEDAELGMDSEMLAEAGPGYAVSVGLALDQGSRINLLPQKMRYSIKNIIKRIAPLAAVVLYLLLAFGISAGAIAYRNKLEVKIDEVQQKISGLKLEQEIGAVLEVKIVSLKNEIKGVETRMTVYPELKGRDFNWPRLYQEVQNLIPQDMALTRMDIRFDNPEEYAADGEMYTRQIVMEGRIRGKPNEQVKTLQQFLHKIQEVEYFPHATLLGSKQDKSTEGDTILLFGVAADLKKAAK